MKAFLIEILIIFFSFLLFLIGLLYSDDAGFYSREFLSSGGDDFDLFIGLTKINILGLFFGIINVFINMLLLRKGKSMKHFSFFIYIIIFAIQLFFLFSINLDTSLEFVFFTFDLFSVWFSIYVVGIVAVIFTRILNFNR